MVSCLPIGTRCTLPPLPVLTAAARLLPGGGKSAKKNDAAYDERVGERLAAVTGA
jgi:hypothetical protein